MTLVAPAPGVLQDALVRFRIGSREYATGICGVREVVRLQRLADLPGMRPPFAGVLDLRGTALPVLDLRAPGSGADAGDVLVLAGTSDGSLIGVAVDQVSAVVGAEQLPVAGTGGSGVLPAYVLQVLRGRVGVVFLVELSAMLEAAAQT
jgi:chemotaxis signal transduction protein